MQQQKCGETGKAQEDPSVATAVQEQQDGASAGAAHQELPTADGHGPPGLEGNFTSRPQATNQNTNWHIGHLGLAPQATPPIVASFENNTLPTVSLQSPYSLPTVSLWKIHSLPTLRRSEEEDGEVLYPLYLSG